MSCFVIAPEEYAKAAAYLGALTRQLNYYRDPLLYLWNAREGRVYNDEDVLRDMRNLYRLNVKSVCWSYNDPADTPADLPVPDMETPSAFVRDSYNRDGKKLALSIHSAVRFFDSVLYQIDEPDMHRRALKILNKYYRGLYDALRAADGCYDEGMSWGEFVMDPSAED